MQAREDTAVEPPIAADDVHRRQLTGLNTREAAERLRRDGPNQIEHNAGPSAWRLAAGQFKSAVIALLLGACALSALLGELAEAIAIFAIVVINAAVGFFQEYRAERALQALRALTAPRARVLRDGHSTLIAASEIVVGDVLVLEAGDLVPADARLAEAEALSVNEAALTGESMPVQKSLAARRPDAPLAEQTDRVFMGTAIAAGSARAEVYATGMSTELGRIAHLLTTAQESETPLQQRLRAVSQRLIVLCLGIVALVAALGLARGERLLDVFVSAVSLAVAAVPEGLPAVVTIALALGVQRMARRNVLVRRLPAVETLGCATVICTDKTGTLTAGVMALRELFGSDQNALLDAAAACCDAELDPDGHGGIGDSTEVAILMAAAARGIHRAAIEAERPRVAVQPFDSVRKRMSILRRDGVLYVKGAVDVLLPRCTQGTDGADEANARMASAGLRVLAVAVGRGNEESDLRLLGLLGIADPPRPTAIEAVAQAKTAGIQTVMITGDHPVTAHAIARELGIVTDEQSAAEVVHARATPEQKLQIVRNWKQRGAIVAMTGDGVNDAPALREAHVGIAMGKTGTEVAREASDVVLSDDDFSSIVAGIREGRGIFDNLRKTLVYLLTGNIGELLVMLLAALAGLPLPLLPLHLLWINLVTDALPALALVMDPSHDEVLSRPPRSPREPLLGRRQWQRIAAVGALEALLALGVFVWAIEARGIAQARELIFCTLVVAEVLRVFAARSETKLLWELGAFTNLKLVLVVALTLCLQLAMVSFPPTQRLFQLGALAPLDAALVLILGLLPVSVLELSKLIRRLGCVRM